MKTKRKAPHRVRTARRAPCRHRPVYETDWLGRTYAGCPVCNRWKLVKTDHNRLAA